MAKEPKTLTHEQIAARIAAKRREPAPFIDNTELVLEFRGMGGNIIHVVPQKKDGRITKGMTIAYVRKNNRVFLATSLTHRADTFSRKMGTKKAIEHFKEGKVVVIAFQKNKSIKTLAFVLSMSA